MSRGEKPKDGVWRLSASQLSDWKLCHRKWFYNKVMKIPPDPNAKPKFGAEIGTAMHAALERYQKTGIRLLPGEQIVHEVDIGKILEHVWDHELILPHVLNPDVLSEGECDTIIGGVPFIGYIDKRWRIGSTMYIMDYKSTKQWGYTKTQEEAEYDPQTLVYAKWALEQEGITDVVFYYFNIRYTYPVSKPRYVEVHHTWESIAEYLEAAATLVAEIKHGKDQPEFRVAQNKNACYAYGKCEFAYVCWQTTTITDDAPVNTAPKETKMPAFDINKLLNQHVDKVKADPNSITNQNAAEAQPARPSPIPAPQSHAAAPAPKPSPVANTPAYKKSTPGSAPAPAPVPVPASMPPLTPALGDMTGNVPIIYFGSAPQNATSELLEDFLERMGYFKRFSDENKGAYYLTIAYNTGERVIAAKFALDVFEGNVQLPAHLVVSDNSKIGHFLRLETRYLDKTALIVGRCGI